MIDGQGELLIVFLISPINFSIVRKFASSSSGLLGSSSMVISTQQGTL